MRQLLVITIKKNRMSNRKLRESMNVPIHLEAICYVVIPRSENCVPNHLIYTFGPVFRSKDNQSPHSFGQIFEAEKCFVDSNKELMTKTVVRNVRTLIEHVSRYCCYCEMHSHIIVVVISGYKNLFPRSVVRKLSLWWHAVWTKQHQKWML